MSEVFKILKQDYKKSINHITDIQDDFPTGDKAKHLSL
jgi:hypothetical protein